jgi:beta-phosphoglucomutase-like phosphatase (HAD superfamily)
MNYLKNKDREQAAYALIRSDTVRAFDDSIAGYAAAHAAVHMIAVWNDDGNTDAGARTRYEHDDVKAAIQQLQDWLDAGLPR